MLDLTVEHGVNTDTHWLRQSACVWFGGGSFHISVLLPLCYVTAVLPYHSVPKYSIISRILSMRRASVKREPLFLAFQWKKADVQSENPTPPAGVAPAPVPTGLSSHSHQLQLTATSRKKRRQANWEQRPNAFHQGNNNTAVHATINSTVVFNSTMYPYY